LKHGPEKFESKAKAQLYTLNKLTDYECADSQGEGENGDQGVNIRIRAQLIIDLLNEPEKLGRERQMAIENQKRMAERRRGDQSNLDDGDNTKSICSDHVVQYEGQKGVADKESSLITFDDNDDFDEFKSAGLMK